MKFLTRVALLFGVFVVVFSPSPTFADSNVDETTDDSVVVAEDEYQDLYIEEPESVLTGIGMFLRDWRERIELILTFDPLKKADKLIAFAEERMAIAELMLDSDNESIQARAEKMMDQAQKLMEVFEEQKKQWENDERIVRNAAAFQIRNEHRLDRIEASLSEENLEAFQEKREEFIAHSKRMLQAINDSGVSERVRGHLQSVKDQIEERFDERQAIQSRRELLLEDAKDGNPEARARLLNFLRDNKDRAQERVRLWQEQKDKIKELRQAAIGGDDFAEEELEEIRDKGRELRAAIKERTQALRESLATDRKILEDEAEDGDDRAAAKIRVLDRIQDRAERIKESVQEHIPSRDEKPIEPIRRGLPQS